MCPGQPGELAVLAVGIVVATLGATKLVTRDKHGHTGREQKSAEQISDASAAHRRDRRVGGVALDAVIVRVVIVGSVAVVLAVAEVVLGVKGDKVGDCEAVVCGDEVEARERAALGGKSTG